MQLERAKWQVQGRRGRYSFAVKAGSMYLTANLTNLNRQEAIDHCQLPMGDCENDPFLTSDLRQSAGHGNLKMSVMSVFMGTGSPLRR